MMISLRLIFHVLVLHINVSSVSSYLLIQGRSNLYEDAIYNSQPAFFGRTWYQSAYLANLFLPPFNVDSTLCDVSGLIGNHTEITESTQTDNGTQSVELNQGIRRQIRGLRRDDDIYDRHRSLALLVQRGGCEFVTKALNAMIINELYATADAGIRIDFLVVYNYIGIDEDDEHVDDPFYMLYDDDRVDEASSVDLRLLSIGYSSGLSIVDKMLLVENNGSSQEQNSCYLDESAFLPLSDTSRSNWSFNVIIDYSDNITRNGARSLLFIMIIITALFPLSRVLMVIFRNWTCRTRRSQSGRLVGFQWSRRNVHSRGWSDGVRMFQFIGMVNSNDSSNALTEEEFNSLPTMIYGVDELEDVLQKYISNKDTLTISNDVSVKATEGEVQTDRCNQGEQSDELLHAAFKSSTSCSICISDFEHNEVLILLPCGHLFHTECITPWLTQKKRSCPLCSRNVLQRQNSPRTLQEIAAMRLYEENGILRQFPFTMADHVQLHPTILSSPGSIGIEVNRTGSNSLNSNPSDNHDDHGALHSRLDQNIGNMQSQNNNESRV